MRRQSDSWVNATQILKVAGIPKSSRTKILDKEIAAGIHEKVQGGCKSFLIQVWQMLTSRWKVSRNLVRPLLHVETPTDYIGYPSNEVSISLHNTE
jgi:hypothetical protein